MLMLIVIVALMVFMLVTTVKPIIVAPVKTHCIGSRVCWYVDDVDILMMMVKRMSIIISQYTY